MLTRIEVSDMSPENMLSTVEASNKKGSPDDDLQLNDFSKTALFEK